MTQTRCGYVALIGAPNAGKSTLMNALVGGRFSIVTPKPQTTRGKVLGIALHGASQIIFVDTPGIFDAKPRFEQAMVQAAWHGADEADIVVFVVDASRGVTDEDRAVARKLSARTKPTLLALNKVDLVKEKPLLPAYAQELYGLMDFAASFMISASRGQGLEDMMKYIAPRLPEGPYLYDEDTVTTQPERELAAEMTREQCFLRLRDELPYGLMVETETWEEKGRSGARVVHVRQAITVSRESHKKILLGKSGGMLKDIGMAARRRIGALLDAEVHLFLFVKVRETWKEDAESFRKAGLEYGRE